jgi:Fe-S-cluster-containing dehydrogenase component
MKSWHLIVDVARCHDCNDCFLADKDEFVDNEFPPYSAAQPWHGHRWMHIKRKERGQYPIVQTAYLPMPCMHCDEAPCLTADGAVYKREDGLVIIDPVKAKGRKEIVSSCPYSAIYWNEDKELAQKCTGCAHLLDDGWTETRCSQVCPTDAIKLVMAEEAEIEARVAAEELERYRDGLGTKPRVYYKNVELDGAVVGAGTCDNFGEVTVDRLEPGKEYAVRVEAPGYKAATVAVKLDKSTTLGTLFLERD